MSEIITDLPEGFLDELDLDNGNKNVLLEQINRFNEVKKMDIPNKDIRFDALGRIVFPAGTIIHGTRCGKDLDRIVGISKVGILTGQAVGKGEDGETFYCADFHRVPQDVAVCEYNLWFPYIDGRCPFGTKGKSTLAFIIQPNVMLDELLSYDCYRFGTAHGDLTRRFTNFLPLEADVASSILYGVPSNAISGIVMGDNLFERKEVFDFLIRLFPDSYVISKKGDLIYDPKCSGINNSELAELRRKNYLNLVKIEQLERELGYKDRTIILEKARYDRLLNNLVMTCPSEAVVDVLLAMGGNADKDGTIRYVETLREKNSVK